MVGTPGVLRLELCAGLLLASSLPPVVRTFRPPSARPSPTRQRRPSRPSSSCLRSSAATTLGAVSQRQTFLLDGGELQSFLLHNDGPPSVPKLRPPTAGSLSLVAGTLDGTRVVGVRRTDRDGDAVGDRSYSTVSLGGDVEVYEHTIAAIPGGVSDGDAMSTAAAAAVGVHCAAPRAEGVGGSDDAAFCSGKAVVLGGSDYAVFLADGLATLGIDVSLVSAGGARSKNNQVTIMSPAVKNGDDEVGFASAIGQFDSLIDTIANEQKGVAITAENPTGGSTVLQLLRSRHKCDKYISTLTQSQQIIKNDGVFFGPGKANSHVKSMESLPPRQCAPLIPSPAFGPGTLQPLLENGVLFSSKTSNPTSVRGWAMKDFWEETSWPRDSSGTGVRYGLPVEEEEDLDEAFRREQLQIQARRTRVGGEGGMDDREVGRQSQVDERNPFVTQISGLEGLADEVISERRSGVVFVAMRSCRTCKGINPVYTRMAREREGGDLLFAKADATGKNGKALGRQLGVVAVPVFVLFRDGIRYGAVSTSRLPCERLDKAIRDLEAGEEFDTSLEEEDED